MRQKSFLYVGTWTPRDEGGIGIYDYDPETGRTEYRKTIREDVVAGYMKLDRERGILYTVDERQNNPDIGDRIGGGGRVFAFRIDPETGDLTELCRRVYPGVMPDYLTEDGSGTGYIACSHSTDQSVVRVVRDPFGRCTVERLFSDTTVAHFPLLEDGTLGEADDVYVMPSEGNFYACLHSANLAPDGRTILLCDRNLDVVSGMHYDSKAGKLRFDGELRLEHGDSIKTGACPRYSAFHPTLPIAYVDSEYGPRLMVIDYRDSLKLLQIVDVTPKGAEGEEAAPSDLCVSADGRFLYLLYRKINYVCVFSLEKETGMPTQIQSVALAGAGPRGASFSPDGRFLLVSNMSSGDITTFAVGTDGTLGEAVCRTFGQKNPGDLKIYIGG